jgi:hypothetical protein
MNARTTLILIGRPIVRVRRRGLDTLNRIPGHVVTSIVTSAMIWSLASLIMAIHYIAYRSSAADSVIETT